MCDSTSLFVVIRSFNRKWPFYEAEMLWKSQQANWSWGLLKPREKSVCFEASFQLWLKQQWPGVQEKCLPEPESVSKSTVHTPMVILSVSEGVVHILLCWWEWGCQRGPEAGFSQDAGFPAAETSRAPLNPQTVCPARIKGLGRTVSKGTLGLVSQGKDPQEVEEWRQGCEVQG